MSKLLMGAVNVDGVVRRTLTDGDDPDDKSNGVTRRPSQDGKEEWEGRFTVFGPCRTGTAVITSAFRHAARPMNLRGSFQRALKQTLKLAVAAVETLQSIAAVMVKHHRKRGSNHSHMFCRTFRVV
jgi:hypothetical protein